MTVRIAILGYGNLGRGVEAAVGQNADLELVAVYTRRDPAALTVASNAPVRAAHELEDGAADDFDVLVICGGSATDLPHQTPHLAQWYNVVDSFDTHHDIPAHFETVDAAARRGKRCALISCGWDPGLFSIQRIIAESVLPQGRSYTFWGRGVSQGHSDAIRRIEGVADARQYTVPAPAALDAARSGDEPELSTRQMHTRECWVVLEDGADPARIEREIKTMPNYFADYDITVAFVTQEELDRDHAGLPHGGFVLRTGKTVRGEASAVEYRLDLESNPGFTGSVLAACARAVARLSAEGSWGAKTVFDVAPAYLSPHDGSYLRSHLL